MELTTSSSDVNAVAAELSDIQQQQLLQRQQHQQPQQHHHDSNNIAAVVKQPGFFSSYPTLTLPKVETPLFLSTEAAAAYPQKHAGDASSTSCAGKAPTADNTLFPTTMRHQKDLPPMIRSSVNYAIQAGEESLSALRAARSALLLNRNKMMFHQKQQHTQDKTNEDLLLQKKQNTAQLLDEATHLLDATPNQQYVSASSSSAVTASHHWSVRAGHQPMNAMSFPGEALSRQRNQQYKSCMRSQDPTAQQKEQEEPIKATHWKPPIRPNTEDWAISLGDDSNEANIVADGVEVVVVPQENRVAEKQKQRRSSPLKTKRKIADNGRSFTALTIAAAAAADQVSRKTPPAIIPVSAEDDDAHKAMPYDYIQQLQQQQQKKASFPTSFSSTAMSVLANASEAVNKKEQHQQEKAKGRRTSTTVKRLPLNTSVRVEDDVSTEGTSKTPNKKNKKRAPAIKTATKKRKRLPGHPKRPLSAYNIFFQQERARLKGEVVNPIAQNTPDAIKRQRLKNPTRIIGFKDLAVTIGTRWRELPKEFKEQYEAMAKAEYDRYVVQRDEFLARVKQAEEAAEAISSLEQDRTADCETTIKEAATTEMTTRVNPSKLVTASSVLQHSSTAALSAAATTTGTFPDACVSNKQSTPQQTTMSVSRPAGPY